MTIICLKWTFDYVFEIRVTVYPEENPQVAKQVDLWEYSPLLESLSDALSTCCDFPETPLNYYHFHVFGELLDYFVSMCPQNNDVAATHFAYPDLALDNFSGTDPYQDAESFIQLMELKIKFALGDAPANLDALANYTFRKKALFSSLLRGPAAEWYERNVEDSTPWNGIRTDFVARFSDGRNILRHRMKVEHSIRRDGREIRNFLYWIKKTVDERWPDNKSATSC